MSLACFNIHANSVKEASFFLAGFVVGTSLGPRSCMLWADSASYNRDFNALSCVTIESHDCFPSLVLGFGPWYPEATVRLSSAPVVYSFAHLGYDTMHPHFINNNNYVDLSPHRMRLSRWSARASLMTVLL